MHYELKKPFLEDMLQMEGRCELSLFGFYKTWMIGTKRKVDHLTIEVGDFGLAVTKKLMI